MSVSSFSTVYLRWTKSDDWFTSCHLPLPCAYVCVTWLQHESCQRSSRSSWTWSFLETLQICSASWSPPRAKTTDTKTSKHWFCNWRISLPSDFRLYVNQLALLKWPESQSCRQCRWAKTLKFPDFPVKMSNVSSSALIGGNRGRMWLHLLGKVSCPYGSRRPHIAAYTISTARSLMHEFLWFLLCVTDFLHGLDASGSCE